MNHHNLLNAAFKLNRYHSVRQQLNAQNVNRMFSSPPRGSSSIQQQPLIRCFATRRRVRDYCVNGMSNDGRFRVALLDNTDSLNEACRRWNITERDHVTTLGQIMSSSIVLSSFLKGEERIRIELTKSNIHCSAEAIQVGEVRGYLESLPTPSHNLFSVQKILYDMAKPVVSTIECSDEQDVNEIMTNFFKTSEQIPTVVQLTTIPHRDPNAYSLFSFAVIVQELPSKSYDIGVREAQTETTRELLMQVKDKVHKFNAEMETVAACEQDNVRSKLHELLFSHFVVSGVPNEHVKPVLILDKDTVRYTAIDFLCRCSNDQVLSAISGVLSAEDLKDMDETKEELDASCEYCNTVYKVNSEMVHEYKKKIAEQQQQQAQ